MYEKYLNANCETRHTLVLVKRIGEKSKEVFLWKIKDKVFSPKCVCYWTSLFVLYFESDIFYSNQNCPRPYIVTDNWVHCGEGISSIQLHLYNKKYFSFCPWIVEIWFVWNNVWHFLDINKLASIFSMNKIQLIRVTSKLQIIMQPSKRVLPCYQLNKIIYAFLIHSMNCLIVSL